MSSKINVDKISGSSPENTAVTFPQGISIPSGQSINSSSGMQVTGTLSATSFVGDGSRLTGVSFATVSKTIAFSLLA